MNGKIVYILSFSVLLIFIICVHQMMLRRDKADFNKTVFINYYGVAGCCETETGCASGETVTEQICREELNGEYFSEKICNTQTGGCE